MALKSHITADEHGELNEAVQAEYVSLGEGKGFKLDVKGVDGWDLQDIRGMKATIGTLRGEIDQHKAEIKKYEGIDPDEARTAMKQIADMPDDADVEQRVKAAVAAQTEQLNKKAKNEMEKLTGERDAVMKQLEATLITAAATSALAAAEGDVELLLPHVERLTRMRKTDSGDYVAEVLDPATGSARISPSGSSTDPMTIAELVTEFVEKYPSAFKGDGATGGGATGGGQKGNKSESGPRSINAGEQYLSGASLEDISEGKVTIKS